MRAAVLAQRETGAPLMIHPGRSPRAPFDILDLVRKEGGDLGRTVMCHIERTIADPGQLFELAATGVYLEYDLFGLETPTIRTTRPSTCRTTASGCGRSWR